LQTLYFFQKKEKLFNINNIEKAVNEYLNKFYPNLIELNYGIINKAHEYCEFFNDKK